MCMKTENGEDVIINTDEEKEDREKDVNEIKTNYLKRFDDIKKDIRNSFWGISFYFLATIIGLILAKIFKLL